MHSALTLSPMSASYTCELAYLHQSKKDFGRALDLYRQAAEYAELASDEAHRNDAKAKNELTYIEVLEKKTSRR